jgi:hypothetical protein
VDVGVRYFSLGFVPIGDAPTTIKALEIFAKEVAPRFAD